MSRDKFAALAAQLSEVDLARVLAMIGAFYPDRYGGQKFEDLAAAPGSGFALRRPAGRQETLTFPVRLRALQDYVEASMQLWTADPARDAALWLDRWSELLTKSPPRLRFQIDFRDLRYEPHLALDPQWLTWQLARRELYCAGTSLALWPEHVGLSWNWPLRIGVVELPSRADFRQTIAAGRYRQLYELVDLGEPQARCDLLLLPADVYGAMSLRFTLPAGGASAIIVTGGFGIGASPEMQWWLDTFRRMMRAGALGVAFAPFEEEALWFQTLIAEIAHNATLDVALYSASLGSERDHHRWDFPALSAPRQDLQPPALAAYPEFLDHAHMSELARRIGEAIAATPTQAALKPLERAFSVLQLPGGLPLRAAGEQLAKAADRLAFHQETADASVLVTMQTQVAAATGRALILPPLEVGAGAPEIAPPTSFNVAKTASANQRMMRRWDEVVRDSEREGAAPSAAPPTPAPPAPSSSETPGQARATSQVDRVGEPPPAASQVDPFGERLPAASVPPPLRRDIPDGAAPQRSPPPDRAVGAPARSASPPPAKPSGALSDFGAAVRRMLGRGKAWMDRMSGPPPSGEEVDRAAPPEPLDEITLGGERTTTPPPSPPPREWNDLKGKVKRHWGRLTDDELAHIEGQRDGLVGKIQERYGISRADAERQVKEWLDSQLGERAPRFVLLELLGEAQANEWKRIDPVIDYDRRYTIALYIGERPLELVQTVVGNEPVDERPLPPSRLGHTLSIAFTPLWTRAQGSPSSGQVKSIFLPRRGESSRATFEFTTPKDIARFRARVVVLYENRVLQSLLLDCARPEGVAAHAPKQLRLTVENVLVPDFGVETQAPQFEAALIVNDNPQGVTGLTAIANNTATFIEPKDLDDMVEGIRKELARLNVPEGADSDEVIYGLDDERVQQMLYTLAMWGAAIRKTLKPYDQLQPFLAAEKMQVVDAAAGAYLPVEFIYDGRAPAPDAKRCPNAIAALGDLALHRECPHNRDDAFYCPAAFWGFSRCIERQPHGGQTGYRFAHPQPGADTLQPLRKSMLAASRKVRPVDLDLPSGLEAVLAQSTGAVVRAQSWQDWTQKVRTESPTLLILLPHSLESPNVAKMPALEISGTSIEWARMDDAYVVAAPPQNPIVLVLGCSTALPDVAFLDFVRDFKANGAALAIGTIATIRGRQTLDFVRELLAEMKLAADGTHTFDEVFLTVKQRLLAKGDPFVLSLLAYGDTGWRIAS